MPVSRFTVPDQLAKLPGPAGERSVLVFEHGTLTVKHTHRFENLTNDGSEGGEQPR